jgi:hypothetical protein
VTQVKPTESGVTKSQEQQQLKLSDSRTVDEIEGGNGVEGGQQGLRVMFGSRSRSRPFRQQKKVAIQEQLNKVGSLKVVFCVSKKSSAQNSVWATAMVVL